MTDTKVVAPPKNSRRTENAIRQCDSMGVVTSGVSIVQMCGRECLCSLKLVAC
jgi:hypothetical protein